MNKKTNFDYYLKDEDLENLKYSEEKSYASIVNEVIYEYKILREKYIDLQTRLAERISVDRAKDIVVEKLHCSGDEAMKYMRKLCSSKNIRIGQVAEMILAVRETL